MADLYAFDHVWRIFFDGHQFSVDFRHEGKAWDAVATFRRRWEHVYEVRKVRVVRRIH